jgi:hypothetical protein
MAVHRVRKQECTWQAISGALESIASARTVDGTHLTDLHIVVRDISGTLCEHSVGDPEEYDMKDLARVKADISMRTRMSLYKVLKDHSSLLLREERKLAGLGFFKRTPRLHAGGVYHQGIAVGVAGAGASLDTFIASLIAFRLAQLLAKPAVEAA